LLLTVRLIKQWLDTQPGQLDGQISPLSAAIEEVVRHGDKVAFEGFTHLIPYAVGHEAIRQRRRDLTLARMTPDLLYDQLIGMGAARKMIFSWGGNPGGPK
jgi:glutaconate CoA-transferase subunit A